MLFELFQKTRVNCTIFVDHEDTVDWNHIITDFFKPQINRILKNFDLLRTVAIFFAIVKKQDGSQILRSKNYFIIMMTKPIIKDISDWPHKDVENEF